MESSRRSDMKEPRTETGLSAWVYRRTPRFDSVEASHWSGASSPPLSPHFHSETQLSIVHSGCRHFRLGGLDVEVPAGWFAIIPARIPHRSVRIGRVPTCSQDLFLEPDCLPEICSSGIVVGRLLLRLEPDHELSVADLIAAACPVSVLRASPAPGRSLPRDVITAICSTTASVAELACEVAMSREGFIRRFQREIGMTPHAYRIAHKTDHARLLLRTAMPPAEVAAEVGFADQSHMGRFFSKKFGTTPARYQRLWLP